MMDVCVVPLTHQLLMLGRTIAQYRILAQLGSGGMGVVYRAEDTRLGRPVALKFVSEDLANDPLAIERLRSEARAASALNHGSICTIYDIGDDQGHPFIVMELMKGQALRERLASGPLRIHQILDIGLEIADALDAAHSEGIVHRDIKPGNIFLTDRSHVKILDFGLAKLTRRSINSATTGEAADRTLAGVTLGTVSYMSPEQAMGEELDGRSDLFSLGVVLYECATGRHPFPGKTSAVILSSILHRAPVAPVLLNPELPVRLQEVINNCLEKDRDLRYQSAADLRSDLKRVRRAIESDHARIVDETTTEVTPHAGRTPATGTPVPTPADTSHARTWVPLHGRARVLAAGTAVAVIAVLLAATYAVSRRARAAPPEATGIAAAAPDAPAHHRLALARASLEAKDYRAAVGYAEEVLAVEANQRDAVRIRNDARAMLARFDEAVALARQRLAEGDLQGAGRALDTAQALDWTAPGISELSSQLAAQIRQRDRQQAQRDDAPARPGMRASPPLAAVSPPAGAPAFEGATLPPAPSPTPDAAATPSAPLPSSARTETPPATPPPPPPSSSAMSPPAGKAESPEAVAPSPAKPAAASMPAATERGDPASASHGASPAEQDDAMIRRLTTTYARAIEGKDLALFRSIKPNLSREEERRLRQGFQAVTSQRVTLTIVSIEKDRDQASVVLRRRDNIQAGGRQQTIESQQTMRLARAGGGWVIVDIR